MRSEPRSHPARLPFVTFVLLFAMVLAGDASRDHLSAATPSADVAAERLVIHYSNGAFEVVSRMTLRKVLPPSVDPPVGAVVGTWFEVEDKSGKVIYRRFMSPVTSRRSEISDSTKPGVIQRSDLSVSESYFSILVPVNATPRSVVFFDAARSDDKRAPSVEVGRIQLD